MDNPKLIFVVDDDPFINMLVVKRFSSEGYRLEAYSSGEECLKALDKNPDLIILDYLFVSEDKKIMNGLEILEKIKHVKPDISVIMLSGQNDGEVVLELARKGIDDYVIKDQNLIDNLHIAIKELFERKN
ncbi:MAG: response regulator [Bacteroidales bacterium]|mgnify:CR=1 FL=1|jgi:CheY-like chemotaxis protein|nr:response regulator [Bacteroidales bacterium]